MSKVCFVSDSDFKYLFKSNEFRFYQAAIVADFLDLDYEYVYENMEFMDSEFIPDSNKRIKRSDVIITIDSYVLIIEMNKERYNNLREAKMRYLFDVFNNVYYKNPRKKDFSNKKR